MVLSKAFKLNGVRILTVGLVLLAISCEKFSSDLPNVKTMDVTYIDNETITLRGEVKSEGGAAVTQRGFVWSFNPFPSVNDTLSINEFGPGEFTETITIRDDTTYYIRTYATNTFGTVYGNEVEANIYNYLPRIETLPTDSVTATSVKCGGNIVSDHGIKITARGVCWDTKHIPTIEDDHTSEGSGDGKFFSLIDNLSPNTYYVIRAYCINDRGVSYGNAIAFRTEKRILENISFAVEVAPILDEKCTGCHGGGISPNLSADKSYHELLSMGHVVPYKPEDSRLMDRINAGHGAPLSADQIDLIRVWIEEGAKNN